MRRIFIDQWQNTLVGLSRQVKLVFSFLYLAQTVRSQCAVNNSPGCLGKRAGFGISPGGLGQVSLEEIGKSQRPGGHGPVRQVVWVQILQGTDAGWSRMVSVWACICATFALAAAILPIRSRVVSSGSAPGRAADGRAPLRVAWSFSSTPNELADDQQHRSLHPPASAGLASSTAFGSDSSQPSIIVAAPRRWSGIFSLSIRRPARSTSLAAAACLTLQASGHCFHTIGWHGVQFGDLFRGETLPQPFAQQISKEVVIAVPVAVVVLRVDEQVRALDIFEGCLPGNSRVGRIASHSGPHMRSRIDVRSRKVCIFSGCWGQDSSTDESITKWWLPVKDSMKLVAS